MLGGDDSRSAVVVRESRLMSTYWRQGKCRTIILGGEKGISRHEPFMRAS